MSLRGAPVRAAVASGLALAALAAGAAWAQAPGPAAPQRPTKPQAAAAVAEYRQAREGCPAPGPECDAAAKQRFVATMNCVVRGQKGINTATLDQDFTAYVDLVSEAIEGQDPAAPAPLGPCFAGAAPPGGPGAPAAAAPQPGAAPADSGGPSIEALRRFRKDAEERSKPVTPTGPSDVADHEKLKGDLDAMRQRLPSGAASGGGGAPGGAIGGAPTLTPSAAVPAPLAPAAPSGTTTIQGGPSAPGTTTIQGGPTPPPASKYVIPYPGGVNPLTIRPKTLNLQPVPAVRCPSGQYACRNNVTVPGACVPDGTICN